MFAVFSVYPHGIMSCFSLAMQSLSFHGQTRKLLGVDRRTGVSNVDRATVVFTDTEFAKAVINAPMEATKE